MRLTSLSLQNVGIFGDPVAIETIAPGFNVLLAQNEAGKSTIFRAIDSVFRYPHTSRHKDISALQPYRGGAPTIACGFEIGGKFWTLKKRYLAGARARLSCEDAGAQRTFDDRDVDAALAELLGQDADRHQFLPLLWIRQTQSFDWPQIPTDMRNGLTALCAAETETATGGAELARLESRVTAELGRYLTDKTQKPRRGGPLALALSDLEAATAEHETAIAVEDAARRRRDQVKQLRAALARLRDPDRKQKRDTGCAELTGKLAIWDEARQNFEVAKATAAAAASAETVASQRVAAIADGIEAVQTCAVLDRQIAETEADLTRCVATREVTAKDLDEAQTARDCAKAGAQLVEVSASVDERLAQAGALRKRCLEAAEVEHTITQLRGEISANTATPEAVSSLERAVLERGRVQARREAAAPTLSVTYEGPHVPRLQIAGVELADGTAQSVLDVTEIAVPGIGTVQITPARATAGDMGGELQRIDAALAAILDAAGVSSVDAFHALAAARRDAEASLSQAEMALRVLAPDGLAALHRAEQALATEIDKGRARSRALLAVACADDSDIDTGDDQAVARFCARLTADPPDIAALEAACLAARDAHRAACAAAEQAAQTQAMLKARRQDAKTRADALCQRLQRETLPGPEDLGPARAAHAEADAAAAEALRLREAYAKACPSEAEYDAAVARRAELLAAQTADKEAENAAATQLKVVEAEIRLDQQSGALRRLEEARAVLQQRRARYDACRRQVAALQLLQQTVSDARRATRASATTPTRANLARLAEPLFGPGALVLGDDHAPAHRRPAHEDLVSAAMDLPAAPGSQSNTDVEMGDAEPWQKLSEGTREQVAILARLAYARVLADRGLSTPVILDDALVFSDDARLAAMMEVLAAAGRHHQIILLSCQESRIGALVDNAGAHRLALMRDAAALRPSPSQAA